MAGASLLTLLDDITTLLDDVASMTKMATQKTAGVLADDLAVNAEQVAGVRANRELPVVWSVAKGSSLNKLLIIPAALLIEHFVPWLMVLLLIIGGIYLSYEGAEKILHSIQKRKSKQAEASDAMPTEALSPEELMAFEKKKISGAIRTDFILSAEIIVIALNVVKDESLAMQAVTLLTVAALITVGVYGVVAAIVKLDDIGYWMVRKSESAKAWKHKVGMLLVNAAPHLMRFLSVVGTIAMFLVGGGIILHNVQAFQQFEHGVINWLMQAPATGEMLGAIAPSVLSMVIGLLAGFLAALLISGGQKVFAKNK